MKCNVVFLQKRFHTWGSDLHSGQELFDDRIQDVLWRADQLLHGPCLVDPDYE